MKYKNGIDVQEGDIINIRHGTFDAPGIILKIIEPQTEDAEYWSVPCGGVLIEGGGFGLSATESLENDEDIIFVRRSHEETS